MLESGEIVVIHFKGDKYLSFISHCFANVLVSGVQVKILDAFSGEVLLFLTVASPGIDRLQDAVKKFEGDIVL